MLFSIFDNFWNTCRDWFSDRCEIFNVFYIGYLNHMNATFRLKLHLYGIPLFFSFFFFFLFMRLVFVKFDNIGDAYRDEFRDSWTKLKRTYSKFIDSSRKRCRGKSSGKSSRRIFDLMLMFHFVSWKNNMHRSHGHRSPSSSS